MALFHITKRTAWHEAQQAGVYRPPSLDVEGFVHLSTARQLLGTAERFFATETDLVVLRVCEDKLTAEVRHEAADGELFPHLYGPLDLVAVVDVSVLTRAEDGSFSVPDQFLGDA